MPQLAQEVLVDVCHTGLIINIPFIVKMYLTLKNKSYGLSNQISQVLFLSWIHLVHTPLVATEAFQFAYCNTLLLY